jgi:nicotinic acid mononucleotide adenylyltransferase
LGIIILTEATFLIYRTIRISKCQKYTKEIMSGKSIEKLVTEINESPTFARILEVGAGVPTANKLYSFRGASKTIFSSESYYAREAHDLIFGECTSRAVSYERLRDCIFNSEGIESDMSKGLYNTVLATTFQVGHMNEKGFSTHGWIGVNFGTPEEDDVEDYVINNIKYYHISIHKEMSREEYINTIGEIGVKLLHCKNEFVPSDCYIDMVLDENGVGDFLSTLNSIADSNVNQQAVVFKATGGVDRIESITRGIENLIIYKGSFNPVTIAHQEVVNKTVEQYENSKFVFSISVDTYQKGKVDIVSLVQRISHINSLGYDVLITNNGLFVDCLEVLRTKYKGNIVFPLGVDTINRLSTDYYEEKGIKYGVDFSEVVTTWVGNFDTEKFEKDFENCEIVCFSRDDEEVDPLLDTGLVSHMEQKHEGISSSKVRELFENGEDDVAIEMIPHEIRHYVIKSFSKK